MYFIFGRHWIIFDLKHGYKATLVINELELDMHKEKVNAVKEEKRALEAKLAELEAREPLSDEALIAMLPDELKDKPKALYDIRREKEGERAEEITTVRNQMNVMENELATANGELQKGYAMTYQNRLKYDFIKQYKSRPTYGDKNYGK